MFPNYKLRIFSKIGISHLKEEGHYFPQSSQQVLDANFFISTYFKNYDRYSYTVKYYQVAFFIQFLNSEHMGRKNLF